jgi:hypothetical protein
MDGRLIAGPWASIHMWLRPNQLDQSSVHAAKEVIDLMRMALIRITFTKVRAPLARRSLVMREPLGATS